MQSRDVDFEDLLEMIRKVGPFSNDSCEIKQTGKPSKPQNVHEGCLTGMDVGQRPGGTRRASAGMVCRTNPSVATKHKRCRGSVGGSGYCTSRCLHTPYRLSKVLSITYWSSITKQSKHRYLKVSYPWRSKHSLRGEGIRVSCLVRLRINVKNQFTVY